MLNRAFPHAGNQNGVSRRRLMDVTVLIPYFNDSVDILSAEVNLEGRLLHFDLPTRAIYV
jgi:hypothetical protein